MSILAYASLTAQREKSPAPPGHLGVAPEDAAAAPPNVSIYIDAMAALVPSEVLVLHGIMVGICTKTAGDTTKIMDVRALQYTFWLLVGLSIVLYLVPHYLARKGRLEVTDYVRMLLPSLAFTAWTMLQRATAFDAVAPMIDAEIRTIVALVVAAIIAAAATILAKQATNQIP